MPTFFNSLHINEVVFKQKTEHNERQKNDTIKTYGTKSHPVFFISGISVKPHGALQNINAYMDSERPKTNMINNIKVKNLFEHMAGCSLINLPNTVPRKNTGKRSNI